MTLYSAMKANSTFLVWMGEEMVWRKKNEEFKFKNTRPTVKHGVVVYWSGDVFQHLGLEN
jgi:hypothetical protein